MAQIAVLIPLMRAKNLASVVQSIADSTEDYRIVVMAATGECAETAKALGTVDVIEDGGGTWAQRINQGMRWTQEPYLMTGADDLFFRPGWFQAVMREMDKFPNSCGVVAVNDLLNFAGVHTVFARSYVMNFRAVLDEEPGQSYCCEKYFHCFVDDEIRSTAKFHGRWSMAMDAVVEHRHPGAGRAPSDEIYALGESSMASGRALYTSRAHLWATD